ncbi:MAG: FAD-dependent oxidoreductase, partial [Lachnospiraceae bacterium]
PMIPRSISGIDGANVQIITDILSGKDELREKNICIIGSGMTGLETAEMLAEQGNKVTVVEMAKTVAPGAFVMNVIDVTMRLNQYGVTMMLGHKLTQIKENAIVLENLAGEVKEVETDAVVLSLGVTCDSKFYENNKEAFDNMWNIGDSEKIGRIGEAVSAGFELGYSIT